jgi:hypothetical protein
MLLHVFAGHLNTSTLPLKIGLESFGRMSVRLNGVLVSVASIRLRLGVSKFLNVTSVDSRLRVNRLNRCFGLLSQALPAVDPDFLILLPPWEIARGTTAFAKDTEMVIR